MKPLVEELRTDLTAYQAFLLFRRQHSVAFLESRPGYGDLGRFSILGINPWRTLRAWPDRCLLDGKLVDEDPFDLLARLLAENKVEPVPSLPIIGGCVGFIAYDAGFKLIGLSLPPRAAAAADSAKPLISFDFYDNFLVYDHFTDRKYAIGCGQLDDAASSNKRLRSMLRMPSLPVLGHPYDTEPVIPSEKEHIVNVEALREQIRQGEVYIANLTDQFTAQTAAPADTLFDRLRKINPAPFGAFVRQDALEILSASPERLLHIDHQRQVETRPIKGTRPRGRDEIEDLANSSELIASEKDRSELLMITDLERNDLSRICQPESVRVTELFKLESYPAVHHLVAVVTGKLRDGVSEVDALRLCFPGGSITGAPKAAAMRIIDDLEQQPRYLYTGCLGYFSFDGQADFNILIRTAVKCGASISYGSGGGITWESDPRPEYQEMLVKAQAFMTILKGDGESDAMGKRTG